MKNTSYLLLALAIIFCASLSANTNSTLDNTKPSGSYNVEKLAGEFKFTEGPAVDPEGNVYFTDIPNHMILIWTVNERLDTFRLNSGRANGLNFDNNGNLLVCEGEKGQITSTNSDGEYHVIASSYNGIRFNQPNDLWADNKGGVYFTDPKYGGDDKELSQDGMHVYYVTPDYSKVIRVCNDYEKPNGIIGTPDGKTLYVTDAQAGKTYSYDISDDGTLENKSLFVEVGCDGMTLDEKGNIYLTPSGKNSVDIYSPTGQFIDSIEVPERPSNVCFGGKNRNQLYITARTSIYRVIMHTKGVR